MKLKKILLTVLAVSMLLSSLGGFAAEETGAELTEIVKNPGFESVTDGKPDDTGMGNGTFGTNFFLEEARPYNGKYAFRIVSKDNTGTYYSVGSTNIVGGQDTTFTFYAKQTRGTSTAVRVQTEFYSTTAVSGASYIKGESITLSGLREGKWTKQTVTLHIPEEAKRAHAMIRLYGEAEVTLDDVSWTALCTPEVETDAPVVEEPEEESAEFLQPKEGHAELVRNGSFEDAEEDGSVINWGCYSNDNKWPGNTVVSRTTDAHSGEYALKISGSGNPWASQALQTPTVPGARYQISCFIKSDGMPGKGFAFKMEAYSNIECKPEHALDNSKSFDTIYYPTKTNGGWYHYIYTFECVEDVTAIMIYARAYGGGTVLVDDISFYMVNDKVADDLYCEEVFTYADREGMVSAWMDLYTDNYPELWEATAEFTITRGDKTVFSETVTPDENGRVTAHYNRLVLTEKKVPYLVRVTVRDKDGKEVASDKMNVYKYDRPTRVREDGVYMMDGKPFTPVIGWAAGHERLDEVKAAGINVVTISYWWSDVEKDPSRLETILALLEQHDLYGIFGLYINMVPAGHPERINNTRLAVQRLKNHPRVFAYALQDEPTQTVNLDQVEELMAASYKVVRDIDPDIPVFCVDNFMAHLDVNYRYADLNMVDPYWQGNGPITSFPETVVECMNGFNEFDKPTYSLVSAFDWRGGFPTADETRHNIYQSFFAGAKGVGYYCFEGATKDAMGNEINLMDTDRWATLKKAQLEEYPMLAEHFVEKKTPMFNEDKNKDVWYRSWVKDGKIWLAALSQSDEKDVDIKIPMTSITGLTVNKFAARVAYGGNVASIVRDNGVLDYRLAARQCVVFEITPQEKVDFSGLYAPKFADLYDHDWARKEIDILANENIVIGRAGADERGFMPDDAITRADFAMYLVRAMKLVSNIQVSFDDVNKDSYYAAELAAGKLEGVLQGIGDGKFNPEGFITRQDMMVMIARHTSLKPGADLSAFADADMVSDYARDAVSALAGGGYIKGDTLGNLNPQGNATRAEAALLIYRLWADGVI